MSTEPTKASKNHAHTTKETEAVSSYDTSIHEIEAMGGAYAAGSGLAENNAHITEASVAESVKGVDKSEIEQGDKAVLAGGWDNSASTPKTPVGRNLKIARESAELIARASRSGCSDREKEALFARFVELNLRAARKAFVAELEEHLAKRGVPDYKEKKWELTFRGKGRTESIVDGQVQSLLRIWFFDPSLTKNYDPAMGVLLSTYRRHDIYAAIREVVRECVPVADFWSDDDIDDSEEEREVAIFRGSRDVAHDDSEGVFAFDDSEFASALEALAAGAEETVCRIATGNYKQSECFRQLLEVLKVLVTAGKLTVDNRRAFLVSMVHDATVCAEIMGQKPGTIRQAARRVRKKLHIICDARGDELLELKELLAALEARSN